MWYISLPFEVSISLYEALDCQINEAFTQSYEFIYSNEITALSLGCQENMLT